jgi:Domain of unknown function (DUF3372)
LQVSFTNQGPEQVLGLLVMHITSADQAAGSAAIRDDNVSSFVVVINARPDSFEVPYPEGVCSLQVHAELQGQPHVKGVHADDGSCTMTMPGQTFCAFVEHW